jgi:DNA-binding PadR family transcriptional regulator
MSSMRLLILGILYAKKRSHGYEVRQELESWNAEKWTNIAYGSIYFALNKMAQEGLLEVLEPEKQTPKAKIEYAITERGKEAFMRLLREQWWDSKPLIDPFQVALTFMNYMPKEELLCALEAKAQRLKIFIQSAERLMPLRMNENWPRHIVENFRLTQAHMQAELSWIETALTKINKGELP